MERTLVLLKPDALQRSIAMQILQRFEQRGLRLVGLKLAAASKEQASQHYAEHEGSSSLTGWLLTCKAVRSWPWFWRARRRSPLCARWWARLARTRPRPARSVATWR